MNPAGKRLLLGSSAVLSSLTAYNSFSTGRGGNLPQLDQRVVAHKVHRPRCRRLTHVNADHAGNVGAPWLPVGHLHVQTHSLSRRHLGFPL